LIVKRSEKSQEQGRRYNNPQTKESIIWVEQLHTHAVVLVQSGPPAPLRPISKLAMRYWLMRE
jgi:hypothetical protein